MNTSGATRKGLTWASRLAPLVAIALALPFLTSEGKAQAPRFGEARSAEGRIQSLTTAPMGEVDGAVLDDGTVIHWPPHLADRFTAVASKGDRIRVAGRMETGPAGDTHLEVQTVTNLRTNASAENDFGPPPSPPGLPIGEAKTVRGRIQSFTTAPMGEVDGAVLDDGTVIHWPPHLADRFTAILARGDRVKASGWMETGPAGDAHLEVQTMTNVRTDVTASNDVAGRGRIGSDEIAVSPERGDDVERRLKALEDQIAQLREEVRRLSREP
jgi:hypothetical protein